MTFDALVTLALAPMAAGVVLSVAEERGLFAPLASAVVIGMSIAGLYMLHEGIPPLPPISSKHKLGYALCTISLFVLFSHKFKPNTRCLWFALFAFICFLWFIQRPLLAGRLDLHWLLPVATVIVIATLPALSAVKKLSRFAWPVSLLSTSTLACALALLGGFLGLGQYLISLSAFIGGYVLALYANSFRSARKTPISEATLTVIRGALGLTLVQLSTFATNLSVPGYILLLLLMCLPLADHKIERFPLLVQPFAFAFVALLIGGPATLIALWNF